MIVGDNPHDLTSVALTDAEADLLFALVQNGVHLAEADPEDETLRWALPRLKRLRRRLQRCP